MSWKNFLDDICKSRQYDLTPLEAEVLMCLDEFALQSKRGLFETYTQAYSAIEEEAFTQRLKNIYKKFQIAGKGHKLPQLHQYLSEQYSQYQTNELYFAEVGLSYLYPSFPRDAFSDAIAALHAPTSSMPKQVDILQTFAPNLEEYEKDLVQCLHAGINVRVLLAWPYSEAAKLRELVLNKYGRSQETHDIDICDRVLSNLETLERIIVAAKDSPHLAIKLYDTLPSLAIYRAGNYMLASPFLHGSLAVNTFQLELNLTSSNPTMTQTLLNDFDLMWQVARYFKPAPQRNWRNDLKILFVD